MYVQCISTNTLQTKGSISKKLNHVWVVVHFITDSSISKVEKHWTESRSWSAEGKAGASVVWFCNTLRACLDWRNCVKEFQRNAIPIFCWRHVLSGKAPSLSKNEANKISTLTNLMTVINRWLATVMLQWLSSNCTVKGIVRFVSRSSAGVVELIL